MAEIVGLAASIIQIVGASAKLSTSLYQFAGSVARADQEIADIAGDVEITANALESVGKAFENENTQSIVTKKAVQDANNLIKRCEAEIVEKRRRIRKDGKKSLSVLGKFSWPMKEQRIELLRRRLESLKNNLVLLLHVIQFANGQAKEQLEKSAIGEEYKKICQLHQRQQESLKSLEDLEGKLSSINLHADVTPRGSNRPSFTVSSSFYQQDTDQRDGQFNATFNAEKSALVDVVETSDSDDKTTDDGGEHVTMSELPQCANQVQQLLNGISVLQHTFEATQPTYHCSRRRVRKLYRKFCREFESQMPTRSTDAGEIELGMSLSRILHEEKVRSCTSPQPGQSSPCLCSPEHKGFPGMLQYVLTPVSQAGTKSGPKQSQPAVQQTTADPLTVSGSCPAREPSKWEEE